jgi:hypothetical protein
MRLAIMQPYFFPYIGYFQLINAVDKFVFYDDVNFIKNGWINRNRILLNAQPHYITLQLKQASSFKTINVTEFSNNKNKLEKTIYQAYKKTPYFDSVWPIIDRCLNHKTHLVSDVAIRSIIETSNYLDLNTEFEIGSQAYGGTKGLERDERIREICKLNNASEYINPIGGVELYNKDIFLKDEIKLSFIKTGDISYNQNCSVFVPGLYINENIFNLMAKSSPDKVHDICENI